MVEGMVRLASRRLALAESGRLSCTFMSDSGLFRADLSQGMRREYREFRGIAGYFSPPVQV